MSFIQAEGTAVTKRDIARHFHLKGADRIGLKAALKQLEKEGHLSRDPHKTYRPEGGLPDVALLRVSGLNDDGELLAEPANWSDADGNIPEIIISSDDRRHSLNIGDRFLGHIERLQDQKYLSRPIRKIQSQQHSHIVGLYERPAKRPGRLIPIDKKIKIEFSVSERDRGKAEDQDIVLAETRARQARITEVIGRFGEAKTVSLMMAASHGIPMNVPKAALECAERAMAASLGKRVDLRHIPLITIDDEDARDFDDAVFAEPHENGWRLIVAIADVAYYVHPHDPLDRDAQRRGNSVYFPDRVIPMLPEVLSNGWCSLKPNEDRPCLAVEIFIDRQGNKKSHRFMRGLMRSAARMTYREIERLHLSKESHAISSLLPALYGAYQSLLDARKKRGTLDLDLPERRVFFGEDGHIDRIEKRERFDSHRLIEEFMIAANVCAAESLEKKNAPCMYRIHDKPDAAKLQTLRDFLSGLGVKLPTSGQLQPRHFAHLLEKTTGEPYFDLLNQVILRSQSQAVYSPENIGHFGLALRRYAHFTSPIRRYADLLVHRSLIKAFELGEDGLAGDEDFLSIGEQISQTERRAAAAERGAMDRFIAVFMSEKIGQTFKGRISGVQKFGFFVTLEDSGADGLVPLSRLSNDFYVFNEAHHQLKGRRTGKIYRLGQALKVKLVHADPLTGVLDFDLIEEGPTLVKQKIPPKAKKAMFKQKRRLR